MGGLSSATRRSRPGQRLAVFLAIYLLLTAAIGWRLIEVQVVAADEYREMAQRQTQREVTLPPRRGRILDREHTPLAVSMPAAAVYADPRALRAADIDPTFVAADLEPVLGTDMGELMEQLTRDTGFTYLGRQLPRAVGDEVRELGLPGVGVLAEPLRAYPAGTLAAPVVGFAGIDGEGLSGLESALDEQLRGEPGLLRQERAPGGVEISSAPREVVPAAAGQDVLLTLDGGIQYTAERLLAEAVDEHDALGGSAVVMDVASGEVLAMASAPGYHPDDIGTAEAYERRNRAVTDLFEPGSVAKAITIAAAIEEGVAGTPDEELEVPSSVTVGGKRFRDTVSREGGPMTLTDVTAQSSNVGAITLAEELGEERLHEYMLRFGFGRPAEVGFPAESTGLLPGLDDWYGTTLPTIAIGQGVSASLLQVAGVFTTIASGGEWVQPTLVGGLLGSDGELRPTGEPRRERAVSEQTAAHVADMLAVVVEDGTGTAAAVPGYRVAGKTGTAQKPSETERGYRQGAYIATFAGFAPAEDPALVVAVMIDEPQEEYYGGRVAAPVFADLMEFSLAQRKVVPSTPPAASVTVGAPATGQDRP